MPAFGAWIESLPGLAGFTATKTRTGQHVAIVISPPSLFVLNKVLRDMAAHVGPFRVLPCVLVRLCVEQNRVVNWGIPEHLVVRPCPPPDDFTAEVFRAENRIHQHLE